MIKRKINLYALLCLGLVSCQSNTNSTINDNTDEIQLVDSLVQAAPPVIDKQETADTSLVSFLADFRAAILQKNSVALYQMSNEDNVDEKYYEFGVFFEKMQEVLDKVTVDKLKKEDGYWIIENIEVSADGETGSGVILYIKKTEKGPYVIDLVLAVG